MKRANYYADHVEPSLKDRFIGMVSPEPNSGCWLWTGMLTPQGYSRMKMRNKGRFAYHIAYELFVGPRPDGMELDHQCFNRQCVNPDHLKPMTRAENAKRRQINQTHCKQGHEFDAANTYWAPNGWRGCRKCRASASRRFQRR